MAGSSDELRGLIRSALDLTAGSVDALASELGVSYHTLWGWKAGRRTPSAEAVRHLANTLERRSGELEQVAHQLREAAGDLEQRQRPRATRR